MNFKVGDKVICISVPPPSSVGIPSLLKLNQEYTIKEIAYCVKCGAQCISVGLPAIADKSRCKCGLLTDPNGLGWAFAERFTKPSIYKLEISIPELLEIKTPQLQ